MGIPRSVACQDDGDDEFGKKKGAEMRSSMVVRIMVVRNRL